MTPPLLRQLLWRLRYATPRSHASQWHGAVPAWEEEEESAGTSREEAARRQVGAKKETVCVCVRVQKVAAIQREIQEAERMCGVGSVCLCVCKCCAMWKVLPRYNASARLLL